REERLAELAAEFARIKVELIVTSGTQAVMASKNATSVIPIVFATAGDPVGSGLVGSLARPAGNVTGLATLANELAGKRLELLREVVPGLRRLAIMGNVANPYRSLELGEVRAAAGTLGLETITLEIRRAQDLAPAFEALKGRADALYVCTDALTNTHRIRINIAALGERLPTMHGSRDFVEAGGLDVLWTKLSGYVPADRRLCGQDSARGKAGRPPGRAADQIRSGREPDDRESAPPRRAADAVHAHRRGDRMRRRELVTLLAGTVVAPSLLWPLSARAQQSAKVPRIGIIDDSPIWSAFRHGLRDLGYVDGQNMAFEYRYAGGMPDSAGVGRGGAGPTPGRPHRDVWYRADACGQAGDDDPHRHDGSWRSGGVRARAEPRPARRQYHGEHHPWRGGRWKTGAAAQGGSCLSLARGLPLESG